MTSTKLNIVYGLEAIAEASYGAGGTFTPASDAVLLAERMLIQPKYQYDGARAMANGTGGVIAHTTPSGHYFESEFKVEGRGAGVAYSSAAVFSKDLHVPLRISGHSATFSTNKWIYAPESSTFESGALRLFAEGQQYDATGVYGDMQWDVEGPGISKFTFPVKGRIGDPVDAAFPGTLAWDTTVPPKAEQMTLSVNAVTTLKLRKASLKLNRTITPRADLNVATAGFAGYSPGRRAPTLDLTVEAEALSTINPYTLWGSATQFALSYQVGSVAGNRIKFAAPHAQVVGLEVADDGPTVLWNLSFNLATGSQTADDEYTLTLD